SEESGNTGRHGQCDVVQPDDLSVPFRQILGRDRGRQVHATISTPRTRRSSTRAETTTSRRIISSDTAHGVAYLSGSRKMKFPICARSAGNEIHEIADPPVTKLRTPYSASLKKMTAAYRIPT